MSAQNTKYPNRWAAALAITMLAGAMAFGAASASAQWTLTPYIWATDLGVDVLVNDNTVVDETIRFSDLIQDVDIAFQLRVEGQRGPIGIMADLFDARMSTSGDQMTAPNGAIATVDSKVRMTLVDVGGLFDPRGDHAGVTVLYGARIVSQSAEIDGTLQLDPSSSEAISLSQSETLVDARFGARYRARIRSAWAVEVQGDVSTGGTDHTWSAGGDLGRSFGSRYTLTGGYRYMSIQFKDKGPAQAGMIMSGLVLGLRIGL